MEKCVDSDYTQAKHDSSKSSQTWTCSTCKKSYNTQPKNKCKSCFKVSRARKKIASYDRSVGRPEPVKNTANTKIKKVTRQQQQQQPRTKPNVLKKKEVSVRQSVQKNTKIVNGKVPDRLGKYVSTGVSSETKSLLNECSSETKTLNECSGTNQRSEIEFLLNECSETKSNMIGNECLSNKEAVSLSNSFESDSETKNIFEKLFDDCLGSTSLEKEMSSQETVNLETEDESVRISSKSVEKYTCLLENFENFKKDDRMTENERTPKKRPRCPPNAPIKIKDHSNYYNHKKIRHVCEYCQKIFKSNGKLNSHVYSHTGERPFDCSNCGKAFSSKFKLVRHLLIHSEVRRFVCQICDRTFLRNDHLKNHYKVHDPQKKMYKCPKESCEKEYSSLMSHKKHMAYHNVEDGDLKCLICGVKYETKDEVLFHLKSHSGSRLFKSQSDKKFKCEFCERLFLTRKDVTRHLVVHTGERDFLCQFCPQRFGRKDHLVRHIKKSHINDEMPEIKKLIERKKKPEEPESNKPTKKLKSAQKITSTATKSPTKENNTQTEECNNKTHIVITVHGDVKNRKKKSQEPEKKKSFQKIESSVPNKKQVPCKNKNSTTLLLQNVPNILIIPNNSIILLRNPSVKAVKKTPEASGSEETTVLPPQEERPEFDLSNNFNLNDSYNFYDSNLYPFPAGFAENETFPQFQSDLTFNPQFETEQLNFDILNQNDLLKRPEMSLVQPNEVTNENLLTEASRQIRLLETGMNTISPPSETVRKVGIVKPMKSSQPCEIDKDLFEEGSENLMLNESILNDFKDDAAILQPDTGILNSIFNQNDSGGNELLRNLLTSDSPSLSPLPGFSQIFHNSNPNPG